MNQRIIALVGVSGVGKTTFLRGLSSRLRFQHLQASALIKEGRQIAEARSVSSDALRYADIDENQRFLIEGFERAADPEADFVIMDGHSIVDTGSGLVAIPPSVFRSLGITALAVLTDRPSLIAQRRHHDAARERPSRSSEELESLQEASLVNALKISLTLGITMIVITPSQRDDFCRNLLAMCPTGM